MDSVSCGCMLLTPTTPRTPLPTKFTVAEKHMVVFSVATIVFWLTTDDDRI